MRGTQSFVQVMSNVWKRPSLTALEISWRWLFGIPASLLLGWRAWRIWIAATGGTADPTSIGLGGFTLLDPPAASGKIASALSALAGPVLHTALWLLPLLGLWWIVVSAFGRAVVLRRLDAALVTRPGTLITLSAARLLILSVAIALWLGLLTWAGDVTVSGAIERGSEPNLVGYFAIVVFGTLVLFIAWAGISWLFTIAPLLSMLHGWGAGRSLRGATQLPHLRSKLFEINLVMGIVKAALVVLALVFSACPLPFQSYTTTSFLMDWSAGVGILYLVASDYFHVVRAAAYLALWRALCDA